MTQNEFMNNILIPLRNDHNSKKGCYYDHSSEEYMSYLTYNFNFRSGDFKAINLDWIYYSEKYKMLMCIEQKTQNKDLSEAQKIIFRIFDNALKELSNINYLGFYQLIFDNYCFEDSIVTLRQLYTFNPLIVTFNNYEEYKQFIKNTFHQ